MKGAVRCASQHQHKTTCCSAERKDNWLTWPFRPLSCRSTARSCQGYACYPDVRRRACFADGHGLESCSPRERVHEASQCQCWRYISFRRDLDGHLVFYSCFCFPFLSFSLYLRYHLSRNYRYLDGCILPNADGRGIFSETGYISGRSMSLVGLKGIVSTESGGRTGDGTDMYSFP